MLDKLKQLRKIKEIQDSLAEEKAEIEIDGVKVVVNGKMEVESIVVLDGMPVDEATNKIKRAVNKAMKEVQITAAKKISQSGGMGGLL